MYNDIHKSFRIILQCDWGVAVMNAIDIARYIVQKNAEEDNAITNLKLQKILYYVQGYSFKQLGEAAFDDPIYKWP